ncbi:MAG: response regulator, partial [Desulfamplus sp.]|nr:response regulator [Desulfamplus sp.]
MDKKPRFFLKIRTKLLITFLLLSLLPVSAIGIISYINSTRALSSLAFDQLINIRETKKVQVEKFFIEHKKNLGFLVEAVRSLKLAAFEKLTAVQNSKNSELTQYFNNCFTDIKVLSASSTVRSALVDFSTVMDTNDNFDKSLYDFFEEVKYGKLLNQFAKAYKYYDIMLINKGGDVVFSIKKESDLGQNIFNNSSLRDSALVNCYSKAMRSASTNSSSFNSMIIEDFRPYKPSKMCNIAFLGAPVVERDGTPAGVVVLKIDPDAVNSIVNSRQDMGVRGETYIIGDNNGTTTYRSDDLLKSRRMGQKTRDRDINREISSSFGPVIEHDQSGEIKITKYDSLEIPGLKWIMVTSILLEEVIAPAISKKEDYFNRYASLYGFSDIMLVSANGDVFYSSAHGNEYGTNIIDGPFASSSLGTLFSKISSTGSFAFVDFAPTYHVSGTDLSFYDSSSYSREESSCNSPSAFIGEPLLNNGKIEMVIALKMPIEMINELMHQKTGLNRNAEIYLVGTDRFSRSPLSALPKLSNIPVSDTSKVSETGTLSNSTLSKSQKSSDIPDSNQTSVPASRSAASGDIHSTTPYLSTTVLTSTDRPVPSSNMMYLVDSEAVREALAGITGEKSIPDYSGVDVLAAYTPINIFDITWALVAKIDKNDALSGLTQIKQNALLVTVASFTLILLISFLVSIRFAKPIDQLTKGVKQIKNRNFDINVYIQTNDELEILADTINEMAKEIKRYSGELESRTAEISRYSNELESKVNILEKMEADLRTSNTLLNAVIKDTTDMIFIKDHVGKYIMANPSTCKAFGQTMDELIRSRSHDFLPFATAQKIERIDHQVFESGQSIMSEIELPSPDGKNQWWLTNKAPYRDPDGNIIGIIGIARNITEHKIADQERKKLETQLRQAQKMDAIGTLAAGIAHDFNNILSAIQGYSEMVMYELAEYSSEKMSMEKILYACSRAKQLIRQILTFSRTSTEEEFSPLEISSIVQEAVQLIRGSIPATIEIETDISRNCGTIMGDPTQIYQVIMNICTNAAHAMDAKGGVMTVRLEPEELTSKDLTETNLNGHSMAGEPIKPGRYIAISIQDTGNGIAPEHIDRIFDPYFTTKPVGKGTGMGLAVAHGIIKNSGGLITVKSTSGEGTTFKIWFPLIEKDMETIDSSRKTEKGDLGDKREISREMASKITDKDGVPVGYEHILIVDDEPDMVEITTHRLESLGYKVTGMTSSIDALIMFEAMPDGFDLIITDQTMPKITGIDLAQKVMSIRSDMPVMLCTGYSAKVNAQKAAELGIREFLTKPVEYR